MPQDLVLIEVTRARCLKTKVNFSPPAAAESLANTDYATVRRLLESSFHRSPHIGNVYFVFIEIVLEIIFRPLPSPEETWATLLEPKLIEVLQHMTISLCVYSFWKCCTTTLVDEFPITNAQLETWAMLTWKLELLLPRTILNLHKYHRTHLTKASQEG